jgi:hypothetical protein
MKLSEYMKLSREERRDHLNLEEPCICVEATCSRRTLIPVLKHLGLTNDVKNRKKNGGVHVCHACPNNSSALETLCVNPAHLYLGTQSENELDKSEETRKRAAALGAAALGAAALTPELRVENAKKGWAGKTEEEKVAILSRSLNSLTPEQRSLRSKKAAETKRLKKLQETT